jgi:hypothetical protein
MDAAHASPPPAPTTLAADRLAPRAEAPVRWRDADLGRSVAALDRALERRRRHRDERRCRE